MMYMKVRLGNYIEEYSKKNKADEDIPVYSVTSTQGFCRDYFGKEVASKDKTTYKIVPQGCFAYNPSRINVGSVDWQRNEERVIVSPLYNVFSVSEELDQEYLYYYLKSDFALQRIRAVATGSVRDNLKLEMLKEFPILLPPKNDQKTIANNLDRVKRIIELRKSEIDKMNELIKARFVEMFGDPVYNTNDLPIRNLNELGSWASGGTPSRTVPEYFKGNIDWYSAGELNTLFLEGSVEKITEEAIEKSATKLFKAGSLLIGMYDTAAFKMGILKEDSASNQACACITPNDEVNIIWLYYELQMMKEHFLSQRRGVRQKNLNLGMIKAFKIPITKREQQDEFSDFVKQVDKSKVAIQAALDKSQLLFDSLMQKYFG